MDALSRASFHAGAPPGEFRGECRCAHLADHCDDTNQVFTALQELLLANTDDFITHDDIPLWHDVHYGDDSAVYAATRDNDAGSPARSNDAADDDDDHVRELPLDASASLMAPLLSMTHGTEPSATPLLTQGPSIAV